MAKKKSKPQTSAMAMASPAEAREANYFVRKCGLTTDEALKMMREAKNMANMATPSGAHDGD